MAPEQRTPLVPMLLAFAAGIALVQIQSALPDPPWGPIAVAALVLACARAYRPHLDRRSRVAVLLVVAALAGVGDAAHRADRRLADSLPPEWEGQDVTLVGVVDDLPRRSAQGVRFAFAIEQALPPAARSPRRVSLIWPARSHDVAAEDEVPAVRAGERWSLVARLRRPHGNANPGGFDLEAWLFERNLRATGYVRPGNAQRRLDAYSGRPFDRIQQVRESVRDRVRAALPHAPYAPVLVALAIGDQSGLDDAAWTVFNRTGTGHLISVSGLHVTVFAVMAGGSAYALARRSVALTRRVAARKVSALVGLVAAWGYVLLAGAEIPAQRTLAMLAVAALGLAVGRPGSGILVWTWALVVVVVLDPWAVLAPGFWLSFFAVGLLIYVGTHRRGDATCARHVDRWGNRLREATRSQAAITLGLVPLSLALFQQVSLIGPLANALAIPAVTFLVVPLALVAAALPFALPWQVAHAALGPLMRALEAMAALPGAAWAQHAPPEWAVPLGVAGVALCLAPRGVPGRWLGACALAPLAAAFPPPPPYGAFRLDVLDVGQGTAVLVRTKAHALLYDTGPRWTEASDAGGRIVTPYLRATGTRRLDAVVVSHRDLDHAGGALTVLRTVPVGFVLSSLAADHEIVVAHEARGPHLRCRGAQRWEWDGVRFDVLFPEDAHYADPWRKPNDLSCVLRVTAGAVSALLAGDIEATSEIDLVAAQREALRADVVVVPHHGSRTSSTRSFVEAVAPRHAVFSVGYRNRFGHPRADVVARYVERGASAHRTDRSGALAFELGPAGVGPPRAARERAPRYWSAGDKPPLVAQASAASCAAAMRC